MADKRATYPCANILCKSNRSQLQEKRDLNVNAEMALSPAKKKVTTACLVESNTSDME